VALGTWSYAFYLVHSLVMMASFEVLGRSGVAVSALRGPALATALLGALIFAVGAAWLLHQLVEVPMERRLRPTRPVVAARL
jgi:peptidoglycan/LPS O-acetylase OafA/YrhL